MLDVVKVAFIFLFILILLRRKISVGYALLAGSIIFVLLFPMDLKKILEALLNSLTSHSSMNLLFSLTLIKSFEYSLRQSGLMQKMTDASQKILNSKKFSIISMPLIIGMLPSLGGAYLSAPMVDSATKTSEISREEKAFINYWYRHPWELVLPLYPGIVLASAVSGVPLGALILLNLPVGIIFFVTGFLLSMKKLKSQKNGQIERKTFKNFYSFYPIGFLLFSVIFLKLDLAVALFLNLIFLCAWFKFGIKETFKIFKYGFTIDVIILVLGVILFKEMLQLSGAVEGIAETITKTRIPYILVFIILPFLIGLITGISVGFVGSTFPLLMHLKETMQLEISIAFVAGYSGVLLSPLHLCLILTKEYFKADITGIYKKLIPSTLIIFIFALIEFAVLRYYI